MIVFGGKLLRPSAPSAATKSRNPPDDSPIHPEARRLHPVGALARPHWKEAAPSAINVRLHRQRRNPPDDSPSHPEARRLLSGELPPGIPKSPIRRNADCAPSPTALRLGPADCSTPIACQLGRRSMALCRLPVHSADCPRTRLPGSQPEHQDKQEKISI